MTKIPDNGSLVEELGMRVITHMIPVLEEREEMTNKIPSLNDLQQLYTQAGGEGSVAKEGSKKGKKVKVTPPPVVSGTETKVKDDYAYCDVHFWLRESDSWNSILQDAKLEANVRGMGVLVFAHNHIRGASCSHLCRHVKGE